MNISWKSFLILGVIFATWDLGREFERAMLVVDIGNKLERIAKSNEEIALNGEPDPDPSPSLKEFNGD